jgi:xylan 1,4-beta-xylosidase
MNRRGWIMLVIVLLAAAGCTQSEDKAPGPPKRTYSNPISLPDEWGEYGLGDPFVFSYNGYYYLYVSTRDTDAGVKVWKSPDLMDWKYEGLCTEDPITTAAYAPEVRYWNGKFYMYTSPAGQGHYVLESDSPAGPFKVVTGNFGRTIDGTTFVDDDGQWYFYYAGPDGIQAAPMDDPVTVSQQGTLTGAYMGGWTEGPTVFKRNGLYYMTYTGNHVFSNAYRVNAAVSDSPLQGFHDAEVNPVLIRTEGKTVGLGHNSIVTGPDLDTQYIVYHNLEGPGVVGPLRHLNIDRIVWNGNRLTVWGPTSEPQPAPELPSFFDRFERHDLGKTWKRLGEGSWSVQAKEGLLADSAHKGRSLILSSKTTEDDYTAEFHWQIRKADNPQASVGAVFSYKDDKNYGMVLFHPASGEMEAKVWHNGEIAASGKAKLPKGYDFTQLHLLRVEKSGRTIRLYADEMNKINLDLPSTVGGGSVGYAVDNGLARFGYAAFSRYVGGNGARSAYQPLPGVIEEAGKALGKGDTQRYLVNVDRSGEYSLHFRIVPGPQGVKFRLSDGDKKVTSTIEVPAGKEGQWETVSVDSAKLEAGFKRWKLEVEEGSMDFASLEVTDYTAVKTAQDDFQDKNTFGWTRYEGVWSVKQGELRASSLQPAKITYGEIGWTDYTFEANLTVPEPNGQNGMLVRVTEAANGQELNQNRNDFLRGYALNLDSAGFHLVKHNFDTVPLADAAYKMPAPGEMVHVKVRVTGARLELYAGDSTTPLLVYTDRSERPFLNGKIGFKSVDNNSRYDDVRVYP